MKNIHKLNGFIYVTSEEKPNDEEIHYCSKWNHLHFHKYRNNNDTCKKIILTNDKTLTNVQQLTPEEEAYCKTVDSVGVEYTVDFNSKAVIVIPKQETIEEVAYNYAEVYRCPATNKDEYCKHDIISAINFGYNHAVKTLYTEEEVFLIIEKFRDLKMIAFSEWFNQNKKK